MSRLYRDRASSAPDHHRGAAPAPGRAAVTARLPVQRRASSASPSAGVAPPTGDDAAAAGGDRELPPDLRGQFDESLGARAVTGGASGGEAEVGGAPTTAAAASLAGGAAPRVEITAPAPNAVVANLVDFAIDVFGTPGTSAVVFVSFYHLGKLRPESFEATVTIGGGGVGALAGSLPVDNDGSRHAIHARASSQPGVFSALRVVELRTVQTVETHGGGV